MSLHVFLAIASFSSKLVYVDAHLVLTGRLIHLSHVLVCVIWTFVMRVILNPTHQVLVLGRNVVFARQAFCSQIFAKKINVREMWIFRRALLIISPVLI